MPGAAETRTPATPPPGAPEETAGRSLPARLVGRITRPEWIVGALVAVAMLVLVVIEPDILEAPVENWRTIAFTVGGTLVAAVALALMLWSGVPPIVRILVLWVPFAVVSWWLISPYFVDDVVDEDFSTSIESQLDDGDPPPTSEPDDGSPDDASPEAAGSGDADQGTGGEQPDAPEPASPVLLGAGEFVGLAGHTGTGDAGLFRNPDGSHVLRFENFDIENGPDLEVYLVPGAGQTSLAPGAIHLGALKGNVGDQTYDLPSGTELAPGDYTALVWCEAFTVEFVGATLSVS